MDLAFAKQRALAELDAPGKDVGAAIASALASLQGDLPDHAGNMIGMMEIIAGTISTREQMRRHIDGYN